MHIHRTDYFKCTKFTYMHIISRSSTTTKRCKPSGQAKCRQTYMHIILTYTHIIFTYTHIILTYMIIILTYMHIIFRSWTTTTRCKPSGQAKCSCSKRAQRPLLWTQNNPPSVSKMWSKLLMAHTRARQGPCAMCSDLSCFCTRRRGIVYVYMCTMCVYVCVHQSC